MARSFTLGPIIITSTIQRKSPRIFDRAVTRMSDGRAFDGYAVILRPWRKDKYGFYEPQFALVIGWRRKPAKASAAPLPPLSDKDFSN